MGTSRLAHRPSRDFVAEWGEPGGPADRVEDLEAVVDRVVAGRARTVTLDGSGGRGRAWPPRHGGEPDEWEWPAGEPTF